MARFEIDREYLVKTLIDLLNTPSPTGDTDWAISFVEQELGDFEFTPGAPIRAAWLRICPGSLTVGPVP